jgi:hypothetical protein
MAQFFLDAACPPFFARVPTLICQLISFSLSGLYFLYCKGCASGEAKQGKRYKSLNQWIKKELVQVFIIANAKAQA